MFFEENQQKITFSKNDELSPESRIFYDDLSHSFFEKHLPSDTIRAKLNECPNMKIQLTHYTTGQNITMSCQTKLAGKTSSGCLSVRNTQ